MFEWSTIAAGGTDRRSFRGQCRRPSLGSCAGDGFCRRHARRLGDEKVATLEDAGVLLGTYQGCREASKALEKIAYEPEPQW
jgi:hypothetical protein